MNERPGTHSTPSRYLVLAAGALTAMGCGAIYMWSIFNKPLMETFGFTTSEVSMAYSLFLLFTLVGSVIAGWLQNRAQSRFIVLFAGVLFGLGWFGTGFADSLPLLYLFFSVCAGSGNGFLYNTIVAVVVKWFPDRRGLANGICIGAIGLSAIIFAPLGNWLIESFDVQTAFRIVGMVWIVVYLVFSWALRTPPAGWTPPARSAKANAAAQGEPAAADGAAAAQIETDTEALADHGSGADAPSGTAAPAERNFSARQMFRTPLFYCLFLSFMVASTSGLMITGHASNIGQQLASLTAAEGAIMVSVLSLGSTLGRFGFGTLSDYLGRYRALGIVLGINAAVMLLLMPQATTFGLFLAAITLVGACFGGTMSIIPAIVGDAYGSQNFGQNYSFVYAGYTAASFLGPIAAATAVESTGTYLPAFLIAGALSLVGIALVIAGSRFAKHLPEPEIR